jgi:DNA-binding NarL/FixJ family response regulator
VDIAWQALPFVARLSASQGPRTLAFFAPHPSFAICSHSDGDELVRESTMTIPLQRSVLCKIAARRSRFGRIDPHPAWDSILTGSSPQPGTSARIAALGGPRRLTQRELEVLHLVAHGETDQGIADQLYVSRRTINCHVANILAKLDVPSRTAAAITAARIGLL